MKIPFVDLNAQTASIREELNQSISRVIDNSAFISGQALSDFEAAFSAHHQGRHVIGVGSGSEALNLAVAALGLGSGDEVVTQANTWISSVFAISHAGATPVFIDIDAATYQMDIHSLEKAITPQTKAVLVVHMHGQMADMDSILGICRPRGITVIEDAAQSVFAEWNGQKAGTVGDVACISFYPGKNLGGFGDGGAVLTGSDDLAEKVRILSFYGQREKYRHERIGWNSRLDTLQAAILLTKLPYLDQWTAKRRELAERYDEKLAPLDVKTPIEAAGAKHVYHLYVIEVANRDRVLNRLQSNGVMAQVHYPSVVHLQECYADLGFGEGDFPVTETAAANILSLPMYAELTDEQMDYTVNTLAEAI